MGVKLYLASTSGPSFSRFENLLRKALQRGGSSLADSRKAQAWWEVEILTRTVNSAEGFFYDPDNDWSLLWRFGLDWRSNIMSLTDDHGELKGENLRKFRDLIANRKMSFPSQDELEALLPCLGSNRRALLKEWHKSLRTGRERLLALLNRAIQLKAAVRSEYKEDGED